MTDKSGTERSYPVTNDTPVWNFLKQQPSKVSRMKSGRTVKVQAMLRRLEKELSHKKTGG